MKKMMPPQGIIFYLIAVLEGNMDFRTLLIFAEGARLLLRGRDRGDPAGASAEEASRTACGKRSAS